MQHSAIIRNVLNGMAAAGKKVVRGGVRHDRSLAADLRTLREQHGVTAIVCLLNDAELRVGVSSLMNGARVPAVYVAVTAWKADP